MTAPRRTTRFTRWTRRLSGPLFAGLLVAGAAADEPATARGTAVALLTISSQTQDILPASVADIRHSAEVALESTFAALGRNLVAADTTLELQRRWRVRSSLVIVQGFLDDARAELGADRIAVVQVMIAPGRIFLAGRTIDTATGLLIGAGTVEPELWTPDAWGEALERGLGRLVSSLDDRPASDRGETLLVLPVQTRGIAIHDAETATHTLLETVLEVEGVAVPDPAVLSARLIAAGHDPRSLNREAMLDLADTQGARRLLVAEILSYDTASRGGGSFFDDGFDEAVLVSLPSLSYFARLVDLRSGNLTATAMHYYDERPESGWFGFMHTRTSRDVLGSAARELWKDLGFHTEASP